MLTNIIHDDHFIRYIENDKTHRADGPAIEWYDGSKEWYIHGERHREDGPAIEYQVPGEEDFNCQWYIHGKRHRLDGPAIMNIRGIKSWWFNDCLADALLFPWAYMMGIDLNNLTEYDKNMIAMVWNDYGM